MGYYVAYNRINGNTFLGMSPDPIPLDSIQLAADAIMAHRATIYRHLPGILKTVHGYTLSRGGAPSQI